MFSDSELKLKPYILSNYYYPLVKCDNLVDSLNGLKGNIFKKIKGVSIKKNVAKRTKFYSYSFDFTVDNPFLKRYEDAFDFILKIYKDFGFCSNYKSVRESQKDYKNNYYLNPLIFEYSFSCNFGWHAHSKKYQPFQLVLNLTKKDRDYKSFLFEVSKDKNSSWKLFEQHHQGSIFSFPNPRPHRVTNIILNQKIFAPKKRLIQLLMPIHPRGGFKGDYIPIENLPEKELNKSLKIESFGK